MTRIHFPADGPAGDSRAIVRRWRELSRPLVPAPAGMRPRIRSLPGLRGVIFDVYGTLFVSAAGEIGHAAAAATEGMFRDVLRSNGLAAEAHAAAPSIAAFWRGCIERRHAASRARGIAYPEVDIRDIWRETLELLRAADGMKAAALDAAAIERLALDYEAASNPVWPMPHARRTIRALRDRGLAIGIVSNAQFFTPFLFEALLGLPIEDMGIDPALCVWSYRLGEAKPSARLFECLLESAAVRGIGPADSLLYVGNDMLNDVAAARGAGLRTALFAGDRRSLRPRAGDPRCRGIDPDVVVTDLAGLPLITRAD